jgi:large subunit ribosomal protein L17
MRHRLAGRHLGRTSTHRVALFRNLARALITHESIRTTVPKAKELRPFIEKLITLAKKGAILSAQAEAATDEKEKKLLRVRALHYRRQAMSKLGPTHGTGIYDKKNDQVTEPTSNTVLKKLFNVIGPRFKDRPGGYTRIMKLHQRRLGDAGEQAQIELLKEGEKKVRLKEKAAPAPAPVAPSQG